MVRRNRRAVDVQTELTQYGEVQFVVIGPRGVSRSKCLHDALSIYGIKMTGIGDIIHDVSLKLKTETSFIIDKENLRKDDTSRTTQAEGQDGICCEDIQSADETSDRELRAKHGDSVDGRNKKKKAHLSHHI